MIEVDAEAGYYDDSGCWRYRQDGDCVRVDVARLLAAQLAVAERERDLALAKLDVLLSIAKLEEKSSENC